MRHGRSRQLLAVALDAPGVTVADDWADPGMKGADTRLVDFDRVPARALGGPDDYLRRPGFWIGGRGEPRRLAGHRRAGARGTARRLCTDLDDLTA
ncbi:hypothetical protein [Candidatus Frankia alpina]|uniref:hypothetical protein n=1 Tax=Candidatus Frankia alpina TaxID=2699483 RepID=UPI0019689396|nr:hypothetical protein [Candidatus Frankia alpina]